MDHRIYCTIGIKWTSIIPDNFYEKPFVTCIQASINPCADLCPLPADSADDNLYTVVVTKLQYVHRDFHKQVLGNIYKVVERIVSCTYYSPQTYLMLI